MEAFRAVDVIFVGVHILVLPLWLSAGSGARAHPVFWSRRALALSSAATHEMAYATGASALMTLWRRREATVTRAW